MSLHFKTTSNLRPKFVAEGVVLKCRDLKNLPILYYWNDRAKNLCIWTMNFRLLHSDPDAAFQPIAKARVRYVCIIQQTGLFWLRYQGSGPLLYALEAKTIHV